MCSEKNNLCFLAMFSGGIPSIEIAASLNELENKSWR